MGLSVLCILNFCDGRADSFLFSAQVGFTNGADLVH